MVSAGQSPRGPAAVSALVPAPVRLGPDAARLRAQVRGFLADERRVGPFEPRCDSWLAGWDEDTLTGSKYLWLYAERNLPDRHKSQFRLLKALDLKTARAWAIKESLSVLWHYHRLGWALKFCTQWFLGDPLALGVVGENRRGELTHLSLLGAPRQARVSCAGGFRPGTCLRG
jgi:hypothetical protein